MNPLQLNDFANMPNMKFTTKILTLILFVSAICGCKKPNEIPEKPTTETPTNYNFNNVNLTTQMVKVKLLDSLLFIINAAEATGKTITADQLTKIFKNEGSYLKSKASLEDTTQFENAQLLAWFNLLPNLSGKGDSSFIDEEGNYLPALIEKKVMGSIFYNYALNRNLILLETKDNTVFRKDTGTAMEHSLDEAFGYFGAPMKFESNTTHKSLLSRKDVSSFMIIAAKVDSTYLSFTSSPTNFTHDIYNGFVKGRDAISKNQIYPALLERDKISQSWERLIAASAAKNIEELKTCFTGNNGVKSICRSKKWSELKGTIEMLQYNRNNRLDQPGDGNSSYSRVISLIGAKSSEANIESLEEAKKILASVYGF